MVKFVSFSRKFISNKKPMGCDAQLAAQLYKKHDLGACRITTPYV